MKKVFLTNVALAFIILSAFINNGDWLADILSRLDNLRQQYPQEKIHLHFDKPYYSIGDDIWFKAYVVNAENNELSELSKILYVDLVDDQDSIRKTLVLPIVNGLTNGDIKLTDSLVDAGSYHIKAYTRWMQNFNSDFIFNKDITIGDARTPTSIIGSAKFTLKNNLNKKLDLEALVGYQNLIDKMPLIKAPVAYSLKQKNKVIYSGKAETDDKGMIKINIPLKEDYKPDDLYLQTFLVTKSGVEINRNFNIYDAGKIYVQFFPEGGVLVTGLKSLIGFKAMKSDGRGINISGYIIDKDNKKVADFKSLHAGMGSFSLKPETDNSYTAIVKDELGELTRYNLPIAETSGYVMSIDGKTLDDSIAVNVKLSKDIQKGQEIALIALQNGISRYAKKFNLDMGSINIRIPKIKFSTGIVQFTLVSSDATPYAERLIFIDHHDQLRLNLTTDKKVYGRHNKVNIELMVKGADNIPTGGSFSVAVIDAHKVHTDENTATSIYSNLLLTSDLKGYIEDPNYYFDNKSHEKSVELDNLLLTQGWRRFTWTSIKNKSLPEIKYQQDNNFNISGEITTLNGTPVPYGKVSLYAATLQGPIVIDTITDKNGYFKVDNFDLNGNLKFIVKATDNKGEKNIRITLNKPVAPVYNAYHIKQSELSTNSVLNYLKATQKDLDDHHIVLPGKTRMLKQVDIKGKLFPDKNTIRNSSKLGSATPDIVIKKEKIEQSPNLLFVFNGLPNIEVNPNNRMVYMVGRIVSLTRPQRVPMLVLLDGIAIEPGMLKDIPPESVEGIEIFKSGANTAIYGNEGYWGVIQITTKVGESVNYQSQITNMAYITVNGFSVQREFYSPVFKTPEDDKQLDIRSTIYWNPNVTTGDDGQATFSFYTANEPSDYKVIVEGLDFDGRLGRQTYTFEVK
ncbi:TonB-dependent receptor [Mucilaginibacter segetis]|uniref:TonB-dependent receptor plug domain-containing protein n=1 Tax=Mucilaginibacter segetis TaxID=2793071 RepID=A0A934PUQ7_9SPHI|nr:TonB-dependent receptor plug domain-containing protein [Mucilaginibacter segetis]MBK0379378.1 TonB-dependent receptor plug domain-containing protein [Mucilaginibacter segetis]